MALGEANDVWKSLPEDLRPVRPEVKVADFSGDVVEISDRRLKAVFGSCYVSIARGKKYRLGVYCREGDEVKSVVSGVEVSPTQLDYLDLDPDMITRIKFYISMWDYILEKREAEIYLKARIKVAPKNITDRERLTFEIAESLIRKYGITRVRLSVMGSYSDLGFRCYDGKHWAPCEDRIEEWVGRELYGPQLMKVSKQYLDDIKVKISVMNTKTVSSYKPLLSFENCVLDIENFLITGDLIGSIKQHSQDTYVFHHIPHNLNIDLIKEIRTGLEVHIPPSKPEEILRIVRSLSPKTYQLLFDITYFDGIDTQIHESRMLFMLEIAGRALFPGYTVNNTIASVFKNIFVLVGRKDTGKSTFLKQFLGDSILGEANYELINIGKLGSRFPDEVEKALGKLARKNPLAAMHLDLSKRTQIYDWSTIRQVSGGDPVPARRLYKDSFDYKPDWKIYISTNDPPEIRESGPAKEALLGRFRVIETKNKGVRDKPFPKLEEKDIEVAILAALYAIRRVYVSGEYSFTGIHDIEDVLNRYTYPEYNVVMEMLEVGKLKLDPTLEISTSDLYQECITYVNEVKEKYTEEDEEEIERLYSLPDQTTFTKRLKKLLAKFKVRTVNRGHFNYFKGLGIPRRALV